MRFTLKKSEILRGSKNFERLLRNCKKIEGKILRCFISTKPWGVQRDEPEVVVAFAVKKILKRAVDRNRVRRLMREAYRLNKEMLLSQIQNPGYQIQILFLYSRPQSPGNKLPSFAVIQEDMQTLLTAISKVNIERG